MWIEVNKIDYYYLQNLICSVYIQQSIFIIIIDMSKSVKVNLIKIEITNDLIKTPKVSVTLEFGDDVVSLPNARFSHKNKVSFAGQALTAVTTKQGCGLKIHILGVTGSHSKELGVVIMNYEELVQNDGEVELVRRGNDDFTLQFEVLYNSIHKERIVTEESDAPSQDSFFEVDIDKESMGRESISISQGKGKKGSREATPERIRPSFGKNDRNQQGLSSSSPINVIDKSLSIFERRKLNENRLSINPKKQVQKQVNIEQVKPERSSEPIEMKEEPKQVYPSTKTIKTIKEKQSRILRATYEDDHDEEDDHKKHQHHNHNPEFRSVDYLHFVIVSIVFWYIGKMIKQI